VVLRITQDKPSTASSMNNPKAPNPKAPTLTRVWSRVAGEEDD